MNVRKPPEPASPAESKNDAPPADARAHPAPSEGGSYIRQPDGSLVRNPSDEEA